MKELRKLIAALIAKRQEGFYTTVWFDANQVEDELDDVTDLELRSSTLHFMGRLRRKRGSLDIEMEVADLLSIKKNVGMKSVKECLQYYLEDLKVYESLKELLE